MKTEYLYAIVDNEGSCWTIVDRSYEEASLPDLLAEGWRPIRETPFPDSGILICLEREPDGKMGFGFGP